MEKFESLTMFVITAPCWNCKTTMRMAVIKAQLDGHESIYGPEAFSHEQLEVAKSHNVLVQNQPMLITTEEYRANMCRTCGSYISRHFLSSLYYLPAQNGHYQLSQVEL